MPFQVSNKDAWVFQRIKPGDNVHATLVLTDKAVLEDISFTAQSDTEGDGTSNLRIPQVGDTVPDFELVNQDGKTIHLSQMRGKPLLLTFIYTRCPLPNYCLLMSHNFAEVLRDLLKHPNEFAETQLLSISIDPEFDKPEVLRKYGASFAGQADPHFEHWQFASGSTEQVRQVADWFGLAYKQHAGQIVHSLRTVLIGKDGSIVRVYSGNDWQPSEVAADFADAVHSQTRPSHAANKPAAESQPPTK